MAAEEPLDLSDGAETDWSSMPTWGAERTIRAVVLQRLLSESQWPVHAKGVRLRGVRISGLLDLESVCLRCPLVCEDCYFDSPKPITLDFSTASRVAFLRCSLAGLTGDTCVITKELDLTGSLFSPGLVQLSDAEIAGHLSFSGAKVTGADADGVALFADRLKASGAFLDEGFAASGAVRLPEAEIAGHLSFSGAKVTGADADGVALFAQGLKARS
ncbi:hypothetical protein ACFZCL_06540, partial [Streptomyces sp. NPDC008159]